MAIDYRLLDRPEDCQAALPNVARLFSTVFRRPFPESGWAQWYFRNPYGSPLVMLGYDGGQLIAHHALIPQVLTDKSGDQCPYMLAISTMIDERYRDLTVFGHIVGELHEAATARRVPFILGFPNAKSLVPFKVMFRYRSLFESPLCTWIPAAHAAPAQVELISGLSTQDSEWMHPTDSMYWQWRGHRAGPRCVRINGTLEIEYKVSPDGVFTVLDLAAVSPEATALAAFAHSMGCTAVRLTEYHARLAGVPAAELIPHDNYTVRLTCRDLIGSTPSIRFSLLLSDVF